jgi:hypothetical protein
MTDCVRVGDVPDDTMVCQDHVWWRKTTGHYGPTLVKTNEHRKTEQYRIVPADMLVEVRSH